MDFTIVVDSREQTPYAFSCPCVRQKLEAGDYSVRGHEGQIAIERKSLRDFVHTVIHEPGRFAIELDKLAGYRHAGIVVEADLDAMLRGHRQADLRRVAPASVLGASIHIALKHRVPVYWCGSRQAARVFTEAFLRMAVRMEALSCR